MLTHSAIKSNGVHELKSASGIDFLFIGVSKVTLGERQINPSYVHLTNTVMSAHLENAQQRMADCPFS